jgi:competence protein ComEA
VGALALAGTAAIAAIVAAVGVWSARPVPQAAPELPVVAAHDITGTSAPGRSGPGRSGPGSRAPGAGAGPGSADSGAGPSGAGAADGAGGLLVVDVAGLVVHPGLVRVPDGSRVADVVAVAGGPLPGADLSMINMARRVVDGEHVGIGVPNPPDAQPAGAPGGAAGPGAGGGPGAAGAGPVNLNTATLSALDALPGVGPATAQKIVDWRTAHGRFASVDQLHEIDGIGDAKFAKLKDLVTV